MSSTDQEPHFTGGDSVSSALLGLAAGHGLPEGNQVNADLVERAQRHGLIGILAQHTDDRLTRAVFGRESARQSILRHHLNRILVRLHDADVKVAVLKGPAVASRYRDSELRPFTDLDLLVPETQLDTALTVLSGYEALFRVPEKTPKADKRDIVFEDPTGVRFNVDLHWDLFSYSQLRGMAEGATQGSWEEAHQVPDSPLGPVWEIPDSYRMAFLAAHAVLDHRFRLILFRDFLELSRDDIGWEILGVVAAKWGLRSTTHLALWIARSALGAAVPKDFLAWLRPRSLPISYLEWALPRSNLPRFDGHQPHPINLASVLLNDSRLGRLALVIRAPAAVPRWWRRVAVDSQSSGSPRILLLVSTDRRRGAEVFTERLREGLNGRGWVVEAVSLKGYDEEPRADVEALVPDSDSSGGRFDLRIARSLRSKVRSFRPDVVVANGGATLRYAIADNFGRGYKLVYIGIGEPHYWFRSRFSRWINRWMLRRVDQVLTVSETTRGQLLELEPALSGRVSTGYTGVPEGLFELPIEAPEGPLRVLMVGSLTPEKNPQQALRVVSEVPSARLRFLGDGPLRGDLEVEARSLGMTDRVEFSGSVTDVTPHLAWAHVLILTSHSEGLPGAILEAGAAGVPAIAVDVGGVREAVEDQVGGFVSMPEDEALIEALKTLDADRERLAQMGKAAREHVMSHFRMDDVVQRYADALIDVTR